MGKSLRTGVRWDRVERAYELYETHFTPMGDPAEAEWTEPPVSDWASWSIALMLRSEGLFSTKQDLKTQGLRVFRWLTDRKAFSPYVDEVAISRGVQFDRSAIENMTERERDVLHERLSRMDDPIGFDEVIPAGRDGIAEGGVTFTPMGRGRAFHDLPLALRESIRNAVFRKSQSARRAAA